MPSHGRWQLRQPEPGSYLWRSPHGWTYLVKATGTHELGSGTFARATWEAAKGAASSDVVVRSSRVELLLARHAC